MVAKIVMVLAWTRYSNARGHDPAMKGKVYTMFCLIFPRSRYYLQSNGKSDKR